MYRDLAASGPWTEDKIVDEQAAQGDGATGATYTFAMTDVEAGKTYYYLLEEIDNDGTCTKLEDFIRSATALVHHLFTTAVESQLIESLRVAQAAKV